MYHLAKVYIIHSDSIFYSRMGISIRTLFIFIIKLYPYQYLLGLECPHLGPRFLKPQEEFVAHGVDEGDIRDAIY